MAKALEVFINVLQHICAAVCLITLTGMLVTAGILLVKGFSKFTKFAISIYILVFIAVVNASWGQVSTSILMLIKTSTGVYLLLTRQLTIAFDSCVLLIIMLFICMHSIHLASHRLNMQIIFKLSTKRTVMILVAIVTVSLVVYMIQYLVNALLWTFATSYIIKREPLKNFNNIMANIIWWSAIQISFMLCAIISFIVNARIVLQGQSQNNLDSKQNTRKEAILLLMCTVICLVRFGIMDFMFTVFQDMYLNIQPNYINAFACCVMAWLFAFLYLYFVRSVKRELLPVGEGLHSSYGTTEEEVPIDIPVPDGFSKQDAYDYQPYGTRNEI